MRVLEGRVAIVTGASSGIGAATAGELARRGAHVVLAARRADALHARADALRARGGDALVVPTDVTDRQQLSHLVKEAEAAFGPVDVVVNNAGRFWRTAFACSEPDDFVDVIDVNLVAAMLLTRMVLPGMLERRKGALVYVGSLSGRVAMEPVYSATKYALRGFALGLRRQVAGSGVSVSLVAPGNVRTDMTRHISESLPEPEVVASAVADLVVRPRREVIVPRKHYAIAWLEQMSPTLADVTHRRRNWSPVE